MKGLSRQRCLVHNEREAVARCSACTHFFCRECIVEHEGKMICSTCLRKSTGQKEKKTVRKPGRVLPGLFLFVSVFFLWSMFYSMGRSLLRMPNEFHSSTIWKQKWIDEGWQPEDGEEDKKPEEEEPVER